MEVKQIYELVNTITSEVLGSSNVLAEDLSNLVSIGEQIANANAYDNYVKKLVDRIGKTIFVSRKYEGTVPDILFEGWEYGSVLQKIHGDIPEATENETWSLQDGASYDPNIFYAPKVGVKFFNKRWTFEVPISVTDDQIKESFLSREALSSFIEMLFNEVDKSLEIKLEALAMRTINTAIAETILNEYGSDSLASKTTVKAVNLLYKYNNEFGTTLTVAQALHNKEFIRYAGVQMLLVADRLKKASKLYNVGKTTKFTPRDMLKIVLHSEFEANAKAYLYGDTFHDEFVKLPKADSVPYWQGTGEDYSFEDTSKIVVNTPTSPDTTTTITGVLGVMFDRDALGIVNYNRKTTSNYNPKGEFTNFWHKLFAGQFVDLNENIVVFFMA